MTVEVHIVNAFPDGAEGGNAAGVVLDADGLGAERRLAVASAVGLSETAFVSASPRATIRLEYFTPVRQVPHCGHATVATFALLRELGRVGAGRVTREAVDGVYDVVLDDGMTFMEQAPATFTFLEPGGDDHAALLRSLGLAGDALLPGVRPAVAQNGVSFLLVGVRDEAALRAVRPDHAAIHALSERLDVIGYYVFTPQAVRPGRHAGTRMFAPRYGIPEESATGMAAGSLACFLHDVLGVTEPELRIEQGRLMEPPSPSLITVRLERRDSRIAGVAVGGRAARVRTMHVEA